MGGHSHAHDDYSGAFALGILINLAIVALEAVFGFISGSMALLADAGHNLSDVLSLVIGWAGARIARRSPSPRFTYGLKKGSILAALTNALLLMAAVGAIAAEAVRRLLQPAAAPEAGTMIWVAAVAILGNTLTALLFVRGRTRDLNVRAAFQHMAADAAVSAAVVVAGIVIMWTGAQWIDPAMSLAVAVVILWSGIGLLRESVGMSLMGVPAGIELADVEGALASLEGVDGVHDLHVWPLSTTETALTAHIVLPEGSTDVLIQRARTLVHDRFGIEHCTIQVERHHQEDTRCR